MKIPSMIAISANVLARLPAAVLAIPTLQAMDGTSWSDMRNMFVFGDSWSDTSFNLSRPQPSPFSPLGNPPYPGNLPTSGARWPVYLTTKSNSSILQTYVLARAGSTVNDTIIPHGSSFVSQLQSDFLPRYGTGNTTSWQGASTLFIMYFGINDVNVALEMTQTPSPIFDEIFVSYTNLVRQLHTLGARNFLFLNMPPMDRAPSASAKGLQPAIADWNTKLANMASNFSSTYADSEVLEFDTHNFLTQILDDPKGFQQTARYTNVTESCPAYWTVKEEVEAYDQSCGVPLREYLWLDNLHPTFPAHEAMAEQIARRLDAGARGMVNSRRP